MKVEYKADPLAISSSGENGWFVRRQHEIDDKQVGHSVGPENMRVAGPSHRESE